jgi:NDP-sugar pyrophosphorylase family protein|tara:strand:- start:750 stop:1502 length:753 start_codon:yes stop_codon:yes gene_type:complete
MKILIPMAGEGSRFAKEGYTFPKPLIDVNGKPMIQTVVENLDFDAEYIFLVRKEHLETYVGLQSTLDRITDGKFKIVEVDKLTEGAACTALLAREHIDNDDDLLIANSDQFIEYAPENFKTLKEMTDADAIVYTFEAVHPKWSFVKTNARGVITEVAEKNPISNIATCGIYWYRKGSDFVKYADQMIEKNIRVNNEFYIAPVYNELIGDGKKLIPFFVHSMWGIGTPEDLHSFLNEGPKRKFQNKKGIIL